MPRLIDYSHALHTAESAGLRCGYPNGGAFVLNLDPTHVAGWSADEDASVRPAWRDRIASVAQPDLAPLAVRAWRKLFPEATEAWLLPVHHWAAELLHGDGDWLGPWLADLNLDPAPLHTRTRADAIAFDVSEAEALQGALDTLLANLWKSDFTLLLPGEAVVCTVHHHKQLWWQCETPELAERLRRLPEQ